MTPSLPFLHLASRSPRRRELLAQIGVEHALVDVEVDETPRPPESAADYVRRLATAKARAGADAVDDHGALVLGADTAVVLDGEILGKPEDAAHARRMLDRLAGVEHQVFTAAALAGAREGIAVSESRVWMRAIDAHERDAYVATGEPMDKAGGYAIQGRAAVFVSKLEGSYSGVMGLPLFEVYALLRES